MSTTNNVDDSEYDFIPSNSFLNGEDNIITIRETDTSDSSAIEMIYGDHFMKLQVGDIMPFGVYVSKDSTKCYYNEKAIITHRHNF